MVSYLRHSLHRAVKKALASLNKLVKFEVIINNESDRVVFNAKLDPNYKFISSDNIDRG